MTYVIQNTNDVTLDFLRRIYFNWGLLYRPLYIGVDERNPYMYVYMKMALQC